jgi:hypothetical protein
VSATETSEVIYLLTAKSGSFGDKWPARRTFCFVTAASVALWGLIVGTAWQLL